MKNVLKGVCLIVQALLSTSGPIHAGNAFSILREYPQGCVPYRAGASFAQSWQCVPTTNAATITNQRGDGLGNSSATATIIASLTLEPVRRYK